jgi:hypothetical protein
MEMVPKEEDQSRKETRNPKQTNKQIQNERQKGRTTAAQSTTMNASSVVPSTETQTPGNADDADVETDEGWIGADVRAALLLSGGELSVTAG